MKLGFLGVGILFLNVSLNLSCGEIEKSNYRVGKKIGNEQGQKTENSMEQVRQAEKVKEAEQVVGNGFEFTFNTGLTPCVKTAFESKKIAVFVPEKISETVEFWKSKTSFSNAKEVLTAYDFVLRNIVDSETGLVNYNSLRNDEQFGKMWKSIVSALSTIEIPEGSNSEEAIAFWVNVYNAFMIDILVQDASAISNGIKRNITFGNTKRTIGGYSVSLNDIEYGILRLNEKNQSNSVPSKFYPSVYERRLHFALVCGAKSCPKLRNFAYTGIQLNTILNENAHMFFNNAQSHVVNANPLDSASTSFKLSELFKWFSKDFNSMKSPSSPASNAEFLLSECRQDVARVSAFFGGFSTFAELNGSQIVPYDWTVNSQF